VRVGHLGKKESLSEGEDASDRAFTQQEYSRGVCLPDLWRHFMSWEKL
jgi:hypothetical protein